MQSSSRPLVVRTFSGLSQIACKPATQIWQRRHYAKIEQPLVRKYEPRSFIDPIFKEGENTFKFSSVDTNPNGALLEVKSVSVYFEHLALRDMCQCEMCVDPSTKQRNFAFADIPLDIQGRYHIRDDGQLEVHWTKDLPGFDSTHKSMFTASSLLRERNFYVRKRSHGNTFVKTPWDAAQLRKKRSNIEWRYSAFLHKDESRAEAVKALLRWGLIFIRNVPPDQWAVKEILERLGPIRNTFYGEMWDVRSVVGAKNVAYTSNDLGFHQDLLYMANPPGLQALHMIKASKHGGESLFTDGARAANILLETQPKHGKALFSFPVTYRYRNAGEWYEYSRPTLEIDPAHRHPHLYRMDQKNGRGYGTSYDYINWSPPFQGPFAVDHGFERPQADESIQIGSDLRKYRQAAEALRTIFEAPEAVYEERMAPGTCVIFNNRRILHARKAFSVDGGDQREERWLRGAYGDLDSLMSRYRAVTSGDTPLKKRHNLRNVTEANRFGGPSTVKEDEITDFEAVG